MQISFIHHLPYFYDFLDCYLSLHSNGRLISLVLRGPAQCNYLAIYDATFRSNPRVDLC
jgi:hypothetical protein